LAAFNDGARLVIVEADLFVGREKGRFPDDVFVALAAPGERQIARGTQAHAGGPRQFGQSSAAAVLSTTANAARVKAKVMLERVRIGNLRGE